MNVLGERIYRLRKDADVSQEKLGEALNVSRHTVSRWETGLTKPSAENLKCLCVYFGVEGNYFFGDGEKTAVTTEVGTATGSEAVTSVEAPAEETGENKPVSVKPSKFGTVKILSAVIGAVLSVLFLTACAIAIYITVSPGTGGAWGEEIHTVNYEGIIFLILGAVALSAFLTLAVMMIIRFIKSKK